MTQTISVEGVETPLMSEKGIERIKSLGKITYDDAFSGPFLPRASDDENLTASNAFHLAGKHDQHTHGRGGASATELGAASRLNDGKRLDPSNPEHARISGEIEAWGGGGNEGARMNFEIQEAMRDPSADTNGAQFTRVVAAAPANAPVLYRGMVGVRLEDVPDAGHVIALGPTSFTRSKKIAVGFATPEFSDLGRGTMVHIKVNKNSRALRIDQEVPKLFKDEQEHVGLGKYHVTSRTQSRVTVKAKDGRKREVDLIELELTQIDDLTPATFKNGKSDVTDAGVMGL